MFSHEIKELICKLHFIIIYRLCMIIMFPMLLVRIAVLREPFLP
jgi:hypothetical protein